MCIWVWRGRLGAAHCGEPDLHSIPAAPPCAPCSCWAFTVEQSYRTTRCQLALLDVVVGQGATVLQLLAGKDEALLVGGDACTAGRRRVQ